MAIKQMLVDTFDLQAIYFDIRNRMASLYQKPATGIPASDLAEGVIPDISGKADKSDLQTLNSKVDGLTADDVNAIEKPSTAGMSGQVLVSDGNGGQIWGTTGQGIIVVDSTMSVSGAAADAAKAGELIDGKAPVIIEETGKDYEHSGNIIKVKFYPNDLTQDIPARYVGAKNLFDGISFNIATQAGVTRTKEGKLIKVKGTSTGQLIIFNTSDATALSALAGKTVNICMYLKKQTTWGNSSDMFVYANNRSTLKDIYFSPTSGRLIGWTVMENVTFPNPLTSLMIKFTSLSGSSFAEGDFYWFGAYEASPVVTEELVTTDPVEISVSDLTNIDTMLHESTVHVKADTKEYIDKHTPDIIGFWNDHIYALPEDFGAVGNGVADDTTAIAACLAYAATSGKAVRGYGKYKTSLPVVIGERYMDVYFREIYYTGNDAAVKLMNGYIRFEFHRITSAGIGVFFTKNSDASPKYANRCMMIGDEISSSGNCIQVNASTYYNTCEVRYLSSQNDNCIEFLSADIGEHVAQEYVFRSSTCHCPNGYVAKRVGGKMYDFTIEGDCKYGLYNSRCVCFGFRHREQVDGMQYNIVDEDPNYNNGALITFTNNTSEDGIYTFKYISNDPIPWFSIDVSAMDNYDSIPSGQGSTGVWQKMSFNGNELGTPIRGMSQTSHAVLGEKLFFIGNHKVFVPTWRKEITITNSEYDYRLYEKQTKAAIIAANNIEFATDYIIGVSHSDIYFNASFGAVGYNDLTVTQVNGNTCTIYDKLGNVLFDGTNEGDGKWSLKCMIDRGSCGRLSYTTDWWLYDGTNEKWEITKIE